MDSLSATVSVTGLQKEFIAEDVSCFFWTVVGSGNMHSPGGHTCIQRSEVMVILQTWFRSLLHGRGKSAPRKPNLFNNDRSRKLFKLFDFFFFL